MCTVIPPLSRRLFVPMTTLRLMVCCDITRKRSNCGTAALQFQPSKDAEWHPARATSLRTNLNKGLRRKWTCEWLLPKYKLRHENQLCHYPSFIPLWCVSTRCNVFRTSFLEFEVECTLSHYRLQSNNWNRCSFITWEWALLHLANLTLLHYMVSIW